MEYWIKQIIEDKINLLNSTELSEYMMWLERAGDMLVEALKNGKKILIAGNGGSAADAQHFAGEIVGRFTKERRSLPAISLCTDPSVVTCIANDYSYAEVFSRQIEGLGTEGDCFIGISTSGNSENILRAVDTANNKGLYTIGLLGKEGGIVEGVCDIGLVVPSDSTPRIQEIHTLSVHILCEIIERKMFTTSENQRVYRRNLAEFL
ncbi:D-sedoheptulose 7-phosphate isomerase [Butyrivibrio sp. LB2008]|uniref:D-sedoheptulose 7-phosphate isomerase n=1 Tax=Butyrivibrio sp. LB2008 TaxID=1408305 RepID=UPI0009DD1484|nr:D-sedoheptulose 7-phosphate isomerase [Butyrivibrio sp. LB2008]